MSFRLRIREAKPGLSKSFTRLADFLLDSYTEASFMTATELARNLDLDAATVVRFSQHLGYSGYPPLQHEIQAQVKSDLLMRPTPDQDPDTLPGTIALAFDELQALLEQTQMTLNPQAVDDLSERIGLARRIIVLAEGPAQPAAYNLVNFLEQGRFPVHIARSGIAGLARALHTATEKDLIIAIDIAREAPYMAPALREARAKGISTAAIVGSPSLPCAHSAGLVLAGRAHPDVGAAIINIEAIIFVLTKTLHRQYSERFTGAEQAISSLSSTLQ